MSDNAEKIIADTLGKWGHLTHHLDTPEAVKANRRMLTARAESIAAALREAGVLTEAEWEYGYDHGSGSVCIYESADEARKFEDADEHIVKRRVGPWEPVEGDPR